MVETVETGETPRSRAKGPAKVGTQILTLLVRTVGLSICSWKRFCFSQNLGSVSVTCAETHISRLMEIFFFSFQRKEIDAWKESPTLYIYLLHRDLQKKKKKASEYHGLFLLFISGNIKPDFSFYILFRNVVLNSASPNQALAKVALKDHLSSWTCGNLLLWATSGHFTSVAVSVIRTKSDNCPVPMPVK